MLRHEHALGYQLMDPKRYSGSATSMREVEELLKIFLIALKDIKEVFKIKGSN
jgi:hypothetical protein